MALLDTYGAGEPFESGAGSSQCSNWSTNPLHFQKEIKVTIEHGHGNHLANEMSSVGYWYSEQPGKAIKPTPVARRMPVFRDNSGKWLYDKRNQCPGKEVRS